MFRCQYITSSIVVHCLLKSTIVSTPGKASCGALLPSSFLKSFTCSSFLPPMLPSSLRRALTALLIWASWDRSPSWLISVTTSTCSPLGVPSLQRKIVTIGFGGRVVQIICDITILTLVKLATTSLFSIVNPLQFAYPNPLLFAYPNPLLFAYPNPLLFAYPNPLQFAYPNPLQFAYPNPLQFAYPNPLQFAYPNPLLPYLPIWK